MVSQAFCSMPFREHPQQHTLKERELEQKFEDGMLAKMSKITDLIAKVDSFQQSDDGARVKKHMTQKSAMLTKTFEGLSTWSIYVDYYSVNFCHL